MISLLLTMLLGCPAPEAPSSQAGKQPSFDADALHRPTDAPVIQLYRGETLDAAQLNLGKTNLPAGTRASESFDLSLTRDGKTRVYRAPLPFQTTPELLADASKVMSIEVDGILIPFSGLGGGGARSWRITDDKFMLNLPKPPAKVTLKTVDLLSYFPGLEPSASDPLPWVHTTITLDNITREGLRLTTPSTVQWTVQVPDAQPVFETWLAIAPPLVDGGSSSDGASLRLSVTAGEKTKDFEPRKIRPTTRFDRYTVDLSEFAGQSVQLTAQTEVSGTADYDYVFLGSPTVSAAQSDPRRIVVIGLDTTRPDHMGFYGYDKPTTPELDIIAGQSVVFDNAWTPAPRTRPSFRSATTGRYPLEAVGATNIGEVFQSHGFATAGIVANIHLQPRFEFNRGFEEWNYRARSRADLQVDLALDFLKQNQNRDSYLFLHLMDPHILYNAPGDYYDMFVENPDPDLPRTFNRFKVSRWMKQGISEQRMNHIRALYDGEMRYMSKELGRFFKVIDTLPGDTLVVVHSDHGEEFWEHQGFEHNHTMYDEVTRAVMWVRPTGGLSKGFRSPTSATLMDIGPTLYELMNWKDVPTSDGRSLTPVLRGESQQNVDIGVAHNRYGLERWAVVSNDHKYVLWTGSGKEELYHLGKDPAESIDLAATTPLAPYREALSEAHLDMPVGPGIRFKLNMSYVPGQRVVVSLPEPLQTDKPVEAIAGVYDPEALTPNRANLSWGEPPKRVREDVATVSMSEDRSQLILDLGRDPRGVIYLLPDGEIDVKGVTISHNGAQLNPTNTPSGLRFNLPGGQIALSSGTILIPPEGEFERIRALRGSQETTSQEETCRLCVLGYLDGEACEGCP